MKKGIIIVIFVLLASIALAQYLPEEGEVVVPETIENRLPVEFHSVTGTESVELDLAKYFGRLTKFYVSQTEHVNVTINQEIGLAVMIPYDPEWRGIEEVIFATDPVYLIAEDKRPHFVRRYGNLSKIHKKGR